MFKSLSRVPLWLMGLFVLSGLGIVAGGWLFWQEDFDFYHPPQSLAQSPECALPSGTAPQGSAPLRFIAFGDFGQGTPFQAKLGEQMVKTYQKKPYALALLLGDNFYPDGNVKRYAKSHFENPYKGLIQNKVQFLAAIGDHDDRKGHIKDEMAYFKMPKDYYRVQRGPVDFFILNTTFFVRNPEQRAWIAKELQQSNAPWKIVIGHHPLYSSGRNGNTEGTRAVLEPLLVQNKVDFYLAGHDHDYERIGPVHGVHYLVSGGGGSYLYPFKEIVPQSKVRIKTHHFLLFEATDKHMAIQAINRFGEVIDCIQIQKASSTHTSPSTH